MEETAPVGCDLITGTHFFAPGHPVCRCGRYRPMVVPGSAADRHGRPHDARMAEDHDAAMRDPLTWPAAVTVAMVAAALLLWRLWR